jgi:hypothetical protein
VRIAYLPRTQSSPLRQARRAAVYNPPHLLTCPQVPLVRAQFENECRGKKSVFFKKRPHAFRWTCCGVEGSSNFGCDHHGTGRQPCTCDFCRCVGAPECPPRGRDHAELERPRSMGRPQPESIYNDKAEGSRIGLNLPRGPDPRCALGFISDRLWRLTTVVARLTNTSLPTRPPRGARWASR